MHGHEDRVEIGILGAQCGQNFEKQLKVYVIGLETPAMAGWSPAGGGVGSMRAAAAAAGDGFTPKQG